MESNYQCQTKNNGYRRPFVERIDFAVEKGFADSGNEKVRPGDEFEM